MQTHFEVCSYVYNSRNNSASFIKTLCNNAECSTQYGSEWEFKENETRRRKCFFLNERKFSIISLIFSVDVARKLLWILLFLINYGLKTFRFLKILPTKIQWKFFLNTRRTLTLKRLFILTSNNLQWVARIYSECYSSLFNSFILLFIPRQALMPVIWFKLSL